MKKYVLFTAAVLFVSALGWSRADAQTDNTIYACYNQKKGDLRRINGTGECKKDEVETKWNVTGPKGDIGEKGTKGDKGDGAAASDPNVVQLRVTGTCAAGKFITSIGQDGSVVCGAAPSSNTAGVTELRPGADGDSQRTILDVPGINLKLTCSPSGKTKAARLTLTTVGDPIDYVFESGPIVSGTATADTPLTLQVLSGDGTRRFFAQMVQVDGSPSVTLHGSIVNFTSGGNSVCLFQWSIATVQ